MAQSIETRLIQNLSAQLAQANLDNTILQIKLSDANALLAEHNIGADGAPITEG
jgi:hypothetical protein